MLDRLEVTFPSLDAYLADVRSMPWFAGKWNDRLERFYRSDVQVLPDGSVHSRARPDAIREAATDILAVNLSAIVAAITCPTLLIRAVEPLLPGAPLLFPDEAAQEALGSLADGRLVDLTGNHYDVVLGAAAAQTAGAILEFAGGE